MAKKPDLDHINASLARWKTRLKRSITAIDKLEKQKKRLEAKPKPTVEETKVGPKPEPLAVAIVKELAATADTDIPDFLRRNKPDPVAEQIKAEQAETKKAKARGRIATMKAKKSGETKKMPLSGRAALAALRD